VFYVNHLVMGDTPFVLGELGLLAGDYSDWSTQGTTVAVFLGNIACLALNDDTCDSDRQVKRGNPFGKLVEGLMKRSVQIELCGTAEANHCGNANLFPGVEVNNNAMVTGVTQLEQQGHTLICRVAQLA